MALRETAFAPGAQADLFATVSQERDQQAEVEVWSVARRARLARFPVAWSFGGTRLAVVAGDSPRILTASYHQHGVSAYALDGALAWHRKDLAKVRRLGPPFDDAEGRPCLAVGVEGGALVLLDPQTGETRGKVKGAKVLFVGPRGERLLLLKATVRLEAGTPVEVPLRSFSVLDAAFSQEAVVLSEPGESLRCLSLSGAPRWEVDFGRAEAHATAVAWNAKHQLWLAEVSNFKLGGQWLVRLDASGAEVARVPLPPSHAHRLAPSGDLLATGDGCVVEPLSNTTLFRFLPEPAAPMRVVRKAAP